MYIILHLTLNLIKSFKHPHNYIYIYIYIKTFIVHISYNKKKGMKNDFINIGSKTFI